LAVWLEPMVALHEHRLGLGGAASDNHRIGLDCIAFGCASQDQLKERLNRLDKLGIPHGESVEAVLRHGSRRCMEGPCNVKDLSRRLDGQRFSRPMRAGSVETGSS
jgi:hypothetical protein